jgi:hypothetical protein
MTGMTRVANLAFSVVCGLGVGLLINIVLAMVHVDDWSRGFITGVSGTLAYSCLYFAFVARWERGD